eukprot:scpid79131/ scgid1989/ E3 ubiquitin-protein ligase Topors; SUMO1-protein E3 ligase Topors; Topoisomerase I-binding RING finger protein; Topoisomerase I-binding arginine/serine-rich protein; Tumor suppressor p53-binding protein 3
MEVSLSPGLSEPRDDQAEKSRDAENAEADLQCPVCLERIKDVSFLDLCFHRFCFDCVMKWAEVNRSCPLCKMTFKSIIHKVRSIYDYEQFDLPGLSSKDGAPRQGGRLYFSETMPDGRRFHYSSTMIGDHHRSTTSATDSTNTNANTRHHVASGSGAVSVAVTSLSSSSTTAAALSSSSHAGTAAGAVSVRQRRNDAAIARRRMVYANQITTHLPPDRIRRQRNITATFYRNNPAATHRLAPWLSRDLGILLLGDAEHTNFVADFILKLVSRIDMDSNEFADEVQAFLHDRSPLFVQELLSFARSPFDVTGYDSACIYNGLRVTEEPRSVQDGGETERVLRGMIALVHIVAPTT